MPPRILITVLSTYERTGWVCKELAEFLYALRFNDDYATAVAFAHNFIPAAAARNFICRNFKDSQAEWLLMLDNDMAPPLNLLDTLKNVPADAQIVAPTFYLWDQNTSQIKLCWGMDVDGSKTHALPDGREIVMGELKGFHELTKCGTGAIFIRRDVFDKVPPPWFFYKVNEDGGFDGSEDIMFCMKARELGVKIYGNGDILVGHHHTVNLLSIAQKYIPVDKFAIPGVKEKQETDRPSVSYAKASPAAAR